MASASRKRNVIPATAEIGSTAASSRAPSRRSCSASSARRSAASTWSWSWPRRRSAERARPSRRRSRDVLAEWVERGRAGRAAAYRRDQLGLHRLALPARGLRAPSPTVSFRCGTRAPELLDRCTRPTNASTCATSTLARARVRALHRPDRIGDRVSDEKLLVWAGWRCATACCCFGPTSWAAAVRTADGGIRVGRRPRAAHAAPPTAPAARARRGAHVRDVRGAPDRSAAACPKRVCSFEHGSASPQPWSAPRSRRRVVRRRGRLPRRARIHRSIGIVPSLVTLRSHATSCAITAPSTRRWPATSAASRPRHRQGARALRHAPRGAARRRDRDGERCSPLACASDPQVGASAARSLAIGFAFELFAWRERNPGTVARPRARRPGYRAAARRSRRPSPGRGELEVAERALAALLAAEARAGAARGAPLAARAGDSHRRSSTSRSRRCATATTRTRTSSSRSRCWSATRTTRASLMQVFQRHHSVLGGMDEAIAVLRECSGRARRRRRLAVGLGRARWCTRSTTATRSSRGRRS